MCIRVLLRWYAKIVKNDYYIKYRMKRLKSKNPASAGFLEILFQAYFLDKSLVPILTLALEIVQVRTAVCNHLEKSTT